MRLWRRASGLLKDQNSILFATLSRRTAFRNPDIEAAVIKATSHDESSMNMKNVDRVYKWLRLSSTNLKSLIWAICIRMDKTRSWVVAIKGLMLMHGLYSTRLPAIQRIGRLPFDLSNFKDGHSNSSKMWGINVFIRAYFAYLDQKSSLLFMNLQERRSLQSLNNANNNNNNNNILNVESRYTIIQDLVMVQKLQQLLDMLLEIKPLTDSAIVPLVLEAMDCVMMEVFDVYSRICNGIARVLLRIYSVGKIEATMALKIVKKATIQGEELSLYFELCRDIGVRNAAECPRVEGIPDEDIKELEEMINGVPLIEYEHVIKKVQHETKAIVVKETCDMNLEDEKSKMRTIITDRWETFDDTLAMVKVTTNPSPNPNPNPNPNPFETCLIPLSPIYNVHAKPHEFPDLISF